jgi:hypothetical protein
MSKAVKQDIETTAVAVPESRNLSVQFTDRAVETMKEQRERLKQFVNSQLKTGINADFSVIPGTNKPSLLKPGAEKLANLFQLGSRIIDKDQTIDRDSGFAMFSYRIEIFHIPTGNVIAQCEGSANSEERKFKGRSLGDLLNTLGKMALKRAYVGGIIMAVGASDFFTQDIEDASDLRSKGQEKAQAIQQSVMPSEPQPGAPSCGLCGSGMKRTGKNDAWYCPKFNDKTKGEHDYLRD